MLNIVIFGPPGAGKGTQAEFLKRNYQLLHLSTGEMLRSQIEAQTPLGMEAQRYMDRGELAPDSVVIGMIQSIIECSCNANGFIFDGFPRTVKQAEALDELLVANGMPLLGMLSLEVEEDELIGRLIRRGLISGRADDQDMNIIKNRISVYNQKTAPLIDYYSAQGKYHRIDGMGGIADIAERLEETMEKLKSGMAKVK